MKNDKTYDVTAILERCMVELKENNEEAYKLIIQKSRDGFFESHQTTGTLKKLARDILDVSNAKEQKDESQEH
jgi:hypothetical protein